MARLLGVERRGSITDKYWLHNGDDNKDRITLESIEDVEPVFDRVKSVAQNAQKSDFRLKAEIPTTLIDEMAKINARLWGVSVREACSELITAKTDRAKRVWKILTEGRDFNRFHTKTYGTQ